jgi:hypothetical protein
MMKVIGLYDADDQHWCFEEVKGTDDWHFGRYEKVFLVNADVWFQYQMIEKKYKEKREMFFNAPEISSLELEERFK